MPGHGLVVERLPCISDEWLAQALKRVLADLASKHSSLLPRELHESLESCLASALGQGVRLPWFSGSVVTAVRAEGSNRSVSERLSAAEVPHRGWPRWTNPLGICSGELLKRDGFSEGLEWTAASLRWSRLRKGAAPDLTALCSSASSTANSHASLQPTCP